VLDIDTYIGFKFLPVYHNVSLSDERYLPALEMADAHNLVVLSHTWGYTDCAPKQVEGILKQYKNLQFILGHSAPNELDAAIALVKKYDNAYLDLCDIHRHSGIVDKMVESVGSEKVLFGTDLPWYDPNYCIGSILCAKINDDQKEDIFHRNAERILKHIKK
jgi:predicted TIM-barrel fold metal-dependent hydrolase